jgi:hypothetical protein
VDRPADLHDGAATADGAAATRHHLRGLSAGILTHPPGAPWCRSTLLPPRWVATRAPTRPRRTCRSRLASPSWSLPPTTASSTP